MLCSRCSALSAARPLLHLLIPECESGHESTSSKLTGSLTCSRHFTPSGVAVQFCVCGTLKNLWSQIGSQSRQRFSSSFLFPQEKIKANQNPTSCHRDFVASVGCHLSVCIDRGGKYLQSDTNLSQAAVVHTRCHFTAPIHHSLLTGRPSSSPSNFRVGGASWGSSGLTKDAAWAMLAR